MTGRNGYIPLKKRNFLRTFMPKAQFRRPKFLLLVLAGSAGSSWVKLGQAGSPIGSWLGLGLGLGLLIFFAWVWVWVWVNHSRRWVTRVGSPFVPDPRALLITVPLLPPIFVEFAK